MNEKINILNIELYQTSAKAAMQKVVQYMESDSINTVEIITMDMLLKGKDMPGWKEAVESLNLVLPGETEILEAAGVREKLYTEKQKACISCGTVRNRAFRDGIRDPGT